MSRPRPQTSLAERAHARALRLLAASAKSRAELHERLTRAGFSKGVIDATLARLSAAGLLDDDALSRRVVETSHDRHEAAALTEHRLDQRHLEGAVSDAGDTARARAAAVAALASIPPTTAHVARYRRVLGVLARKGYDEETALEAARAVLGEPPESGEAP
ncbi:MAG: hypothetical protein HBSAPP03_20460 [Phycisphaerae bacterium]|nr:MAG: hypothetical protein HBSAPP03_20460 [Phycisphaerae bacterium]